MNSETMEGETKCGRLKMGFRNRNRFQNRLEPEPDFNRNRFFNLKPESVFFLASKRLFTATNG